ncbi:MAG: T9SS type A sorting domain-containing protein, partial [Bacteroidota bacterium]
IVRADNGTNAQNDDFTIDFGGNANNWLMPGDQLMFSLEYHLDPTAFPGTPISIFSEISANDDDNNSSTAPPVDVDSTPDDMNNTGTGEDENANLEDDAFDGAVKQNPATDDEDDHDIEALDPDLILPVELLGFKATAAKDHIDLTWSTANELNNSHFDLERSEDAKAFKPIARIQGQRTTLEQTDYTYEDHEAIPNVLYYYRLKQVDTDGSFEYSEIRTARLEEAMNEMTIAPNPIGLDQELQVRYFAQELAVNFVILDIHGRPVLQVKQDLSAIGWHTLQIDLSGLAAGTYILMDEQGSALNFIIADK